MPDAALGAGTLFWLLTSNTYPDYDGYTVYTSRVAASEPRPAWPSLTPELFEAVRPLCRCSFLQPSPESANAHMAQDGGMGIYLLCWMLKSMASQMFCSPCA